MSDPLTRCESLLAARRIPEAVQCFNRAEETGAAPGQCAAGRWMAFMLSGDFDSAWRESDAIRQRGTPDPHRFWRGEDLRGKRIILRCLHGFGDATQFLRYAPRLRALASRLTIEVHPRFVQLAHRFDGVDEVITWGPLAPKEPVPWDVQLEIMELPYIFRTQAGELPIAERYLRLPAPEALRTGFQGRLRVGVGWNTGIWNLSRAIPLDMLSPLLAAPGCEFWSLDGEDGVKNSGPATVYMHEDALCRTTIEGLAATIAQLDLVITVDTLAAHLAGALGIDTWILLQHAADWRWMHDRDDSPWYPSVRLFRQAAPGDWQGVISSVLLALENKVQTIQEGARGSHEAV